MTLDPGRDPVTLVIVTVNASHGGGAASGGVAGAAVVACRDIPVDLVQAGERAYCAQARTRGGRHVSGVGA